MSQQPYAPPYATFGLASQCLAEFPPLYKELASIEGTSLQAPFLDCLEFDTPARIDTIYHRACGGACKSMLAENLETCRWQEGAISGTQRACREIFV